MKTIKKMLMSVLVLTLLVAAVVPAAVLAEEAPATETTETAAPTEPAAPVKKVKPIAQKLEKVTCTASGKVLISFRSSVTYVEPVSVSIKAEDGTEMTCKVIKKNRRLMAVKATGLVKGQKYTLTIDGVKAKNLAEAATIEKTFTAKGMKTAVKVEKVVKSKEYKKVFILKLKCSAYYKDAEVTVTDADGNAMAAKIVKKAKGNIKVKITGAVKGQKYTVTVTGIKTKKEKNFSSVTKTFTAK